MTVNRLGGSLKRMFTSLPCDVGAPRLDTANWARGDLPELRSVIKNHPGIFSVGKSRLFVIYQVCTPEILIARWLNL